MFTRYHPDHSTLLSPPTNRIARRTLSKANRTLISLRPCRPGPEFLHVGVAATSDGVDERPPQHRTLIGQHPHRGEQRFSVGLSETLGPPATRRMELDHPGRLHHSITIPLSGRGRSPDRSQPEPIPGNACRPSLWSWSTASLALANDAEQCNSLIYLVDFHAVLKGSTDRFGTGSKPGPIGTDHTAHSRTQQAKMRPTAPDWDRPHTGSSNEPLPQGVLTAGLSSDTTGPPARCA
jgi:hypothetical protein